METWETERGKTEELRLKLSVWSADRSLYAPVCQAIVL